MNDKTLEIFKLCEKLVELLQDKEAIADLELLFKRHPEMFKDKKEVKELIDKVVSEPEIAINANRDNRAYEVIKVAKKLDDKKMGDIVIKKDKGLSEIFHANKKRVKEFERLKKKKNLLQVETPILSTRQLNGLELMDRNPSGANTLSAIDRNILPNSTYQSQAIQGEKAMDMLRQEYEENSSEKDKQFLAIHHKLLLF